MYGLPFNGTRIYQCHIGKPLRAWTSSHIGKPLGRALSPVGAALHKFKSCIRPARAKEHSMDVDTLGMPPPLSPSFIAGSDAGTPANTLLPQTNLPASGLPADGKRSTEVGKDAAEDITVRMEVSNHSKDPGSYV